MKRFQFTDGGFGMGKSVLQEVKLCNPKSERTLDWPLNLYNTTAAVWADKYPKLQTLCLTDTKGHLAVTSTEIPDLQGFTKLHCLTIKCVRIGVWKGLPLELRVLHIVGGGKLPDSVFLAPVRSLVLENWSTPIIHWPVSFLMRGQRRKTFHSISIDMHPDVLLEGETLAGLFGMASRALVFRQEDTDTSKAGLPLSMKPLHLDPHLERLLLASTTATTLLLYRCYYATPAMTLPKSLKIIWLRLASVGPTAIEQSVLYDFLVHFLSLIKHSMTLYIQAEDRMFRLIDRVSSTVKDVDVQLVREGDVDADATDMDDEEVPQGTSQEEDEMITTNGKTMKKRIFTRFVRPRFNVQTFDELT